MTLTLHNTTKLITLNGLPCRVWEGKTAAGVEVFAYITRVQVRRDADLTEFERELTEQRPPSVEADAVIPLRMIL